MKLQMHSSSISVWHSTIQLIALMQSGLSHTPMLLMVTCDGAAVAAGTNDVARAEFPKDKGGDHAFELRFAQETFAFMKNATVLYAKPDIQFFLNTGACGS
eukprot:COSAG02_NODE_624_length_19387_cov_90.736002_8_plen_101_part_00